MDIKWNMALLSMRTDRFWKKTWKKISIQGTDVVGFDKSKVECFNCHKMGHFARECRAPRSQDRGRRDNYRPGSKVEEQAPKALMVIDGVGWDWSYMANDEENHALVADEEAPTEFALMAKTSAESEVFDSSVCSKACKKNIDSLNSKITDLTDKLFDPKNMIYHYKLGLAQVEARLAEHRSQKLKYCEKIRVLEFKTESGENCIESLTKDLELLKKEKGELETKLTGFQTASKDLDSLFESQRLDKNKEGLGYSVVPYPPAQIYSPPKKDMSWTGLPEFKDDTVTDYSRPSPAIESTSDDAQNRNPSVTETEASPSTISSKYFIKFVKANDSPTKSKTYKVETAKKPPVKYAEQYRKPTKKPNVRGNQRNWNNLKSHHLGLNFVMKKKACFNCGDFNHLAYDCCKRGSSQNNIDDKGYWDSGCPRHMTCNISYLSDYEPFDRGYVSFECIVLGQNFKLSDDDNVLLRTPRQHNMYSIDLNNIVPHKDLTCLVAKASADECMLWHRRLGTKVDASKDEKKDMSSLRYIVLPNWGHKDNLESTSTTKKTKKNILKQQYGNFKAEGTETSEQTFNRLQLIVYESEVQKKSESNSQNMAFISSTKHSSGNEEVNIASVSTTSTNVSSASANIGATSISQDTACAYIASQSSGSQIKFKD
nr:ribonuclease H-like domain-containing protein [Tanacetum cinerariifolium]